MRFLLSHVAPGDDVGKKIPYFLMLFHYKQLAFIVKLKLQGR